MADKESGLVMIEAVYVVVIAVMVIFFTINIGAVYHNRIIAVSVADEAASGVAEVYGCMGKEPFYAYTAPEYFAGRNVYRYLFGGRAALNSVAEEKGEWYAGYLISELEFIPEANMDFSGVTVKCEKNGIGARTVSVTLKREYPVFIVNPASFFGFHPQYTVEATGNAVCYDIIHQMNAAAFINELENKADGSIAVLSIIKSVLQIISHISDMVSAA